MNGIKFCTFYNENDSGQNYLVTQCVLPNGELNDTATKYPTSGRGDAKGIIGNDRVVVVGNKCLFAGNDLDQTITQYKFPSECDATPTIVSETLVQSVNQKCNKFSIDDISLAVSPDNKCLFVGLADILEPNNLYSYKLNLDDCSLIRADVLTAPNWLTFLPYRINGLTVSSDNSLVGVSFTSGFGAQAFARYNSSDCKFTSNFTVKRDSTQPGLSTRSIFSTDANGKNILITAVADNNLRKGTIDVRPVDSFTAASSNPIFLTSLNDAVTTSVIFTQNNQKWIYVGDPMGPISVMNIGADGRPVNGSDIRVGSVTPRVTGLQISASGELVVSQTTGFSVFKINPQDATNLTFIGNYQSGNVTYGNSGIFQLPRCCWDGLDAFNIIGDQNVEIDCAEEEAVPLYSIESQYCQPTVTNTSTTVASNCSILPNIIFNFTAKTCCNKYSKNFVQNIIRVDSSPPSINIISTNNPQKPTSIDINPQCANSNITRKALPASNRKKHVPEFETEEAEEISLDDLSLPKTEDQNNDPSNTPSSDAPGVQASLPCKNMSECQFITEGVSFIETSDDCSDTQTLSHSIAVTKNAVCDPLTKIYANGEIIYTATDACGNSRNATQNFQLKDISTPKMPNYNPVVILSICETIDAVDEGTNNLCNLNFTDSCTNVTCQLIKTGNETNVCKPLERSYRLTDECGNEAVYKRIFKRKETMNHYIKRKVISKVEETNICLKDSYNLTYGFFDSQLPCNNSNIVVHEPVTISNSTCFSLQIHCRTLHTECVELCSCIPLRINSLPIKLHTNQLLNKHQQDLNVTNDETYDFKVNDFEVPTVTTPCGEQFNATDFISKGGNITVVYFVSSPIQLIEESLSIYNYKRELRVVYLFDNGCDYEMIPTAESYFVVQGTKTFLENLFIPSRDEFQSYLLQQFGIPQIKKSHGKRSQKLFKVTTGRFSNW